MGKHGQRGMIEEWLDAMTLEELERFNADAEMNLLRGRRIDRGDFADLVKPIVGLPVSKVWRGYGSAIFLELGELHSTTSWRGKISDQGEATIMIEWSWRVEAKRSIRFGSWSEDRKIDRGLPTLVGRSVRGLEIVGRLPELVVELSGGLWVHSFMTAEGQPEWCVFLPSRHVHREYGGSEWITVERGALRHQMQIDRRRLQ